MIGRGENGLDGSAFPARPPCLWRPRPIASETQENILSILIIISQILQIHLIWLKLIASLFLDLSLSISHKYIDTDTIDWRWDGVGDSGGRSWAQVGATCARALSPITSENLINHVHLSPLIWYIAIIYTGEKRGSHSWVTSSLIIFSLSLSLIKESWDSNKIPRAFGGKEWVWVWKKGWRDSAMNSLFFLGKE